MDLTIMDAAFKNAEKHIDDYFLFTSELGKITFPYINECKELLADTVDDPFSDKYILSVKNIHREIIKSNGRYQYSLDMEGCHHIKIPDETFMLWHKDAKKVGNYLQSYGFLLENLNLSPGAAVLEMGGGLGSLTEFLVRMDYEVTYVDVNQEQCDFTKRKIRRMSNKACNFICKNFNSFIGEDKNKYDAVIFYASFHHELYHFELLKKIFQNNMKDHGVVVLAAEPIFDDENVSESVLPYPWGCRFDGESLYQMRKNGWLELGFKKSYFLSMCKRLNIAVNHVSNGMTTWFDLYILHNPEHFKSIRTTNQKKITNFQCMETWLDILVSVGKTEDCLKRKGWKSVIIYGYGVIGKKLYASLLHSDINIAAVIDKNAKKDSLSTPPPNIVNDIQTVDDNICYDAIIVTALSDFDEIYTQLKKHTISPVISFQQLLNEYHNQ